MHRVACPGLSPSARSAKSSVHMSARITAKNMELLFFSEDEKSGEQKAREEHLLRELFELIDERDKLERKKMTNMKK